MEWPTFFQVVENLVSKDSKLSVHVVGKVIQRTSFYRSHVTSN